MFRTTNKQEIHTSYVDDIIRLTKNSNEIIKLKSTSKKKNNCAIKFSYELSVKNKIASLDVWRELNSNSFNTQLYKKALKTCAYNRECLQRNKIAVIKRIS